MTTKKPAEIDDGMGGTYRPGVIIAIPDRGSEPPDAVELSRAVMAMLKETNGKPEKRAEAMTQMLRRFMSDNKACGHEVLFDVWNAVVAKIIYQAELARSLLNERELATVLAALRYWQRVGLPQDSYGPEDDIASAGGTIGILEPHEIDELCERLNVAPWS